MQIAILWVLPYDLNTKDLHLCYSIRKNKAPCQTDNKETQVHSAAKRVTKQTACNDFSVPNFIVLTCQCCFRITKQPLLAIQKIFIP